MAAAQVRRNRLSEILLAWLEANLDFANGDKRAQIFVGQIRKRKKRAAFGWFDANTLSMKKTGFIIFAILVMLLDPLTPPPPLPPR